MLCNRTPFMSTQQTLSNDTVADAATQEEALPLSGLSLIGTILAPSGARALLRQGRRIRQVGTGDRIAGHTVAAIEAGQIVLARGGTTQVLQIPGQ